MSKFLERFFRWIGSLIDSRSEQGASLDSNDIERKEGNNDSVGSGASLPTDGKAGTETIDSKHTGGSEGGDSSSHGESSESDEQCLSSGNEKQEDALTETKTDPDTSAYSGTDQTENTKAIDSASTGASEDDDSGSDEESSESDEQRSSSGNEKQEDASTETETDPNTSTSSGIDQTDDTKAIDSADTGGSEGDDSGSDEESSEDEEQGAPPGHDEQEDTSTESEAEPDTSTPSGNDQTENTEAMDSTDTGGSEGDNLRSDEDFIEDEEQGAPPGHDEQEDTSTESQGKPDASTPSGTDQMENTEAMDSTDTGGSEGDDSGSDEEPIEGNGQHSSSGEDKQEDTSTETETDSDTTSSSGIDQTDETEATDSVDAGGGEGDESCSDEKFIDSGEQRGPLGHDGQEDSPSEPHYSNSADTNQNDTSNVSSNTTEANARLGTRTPRNIGGRRNGKNKDQISNDSKSSTSFSPRPELICRRISNSLEWAIFLTVPKECNIAEVRQNDTQLHLENREYRLPSFSGNVSVTYTSDGTVDGFALFDNASPLIFKLRNHWEGDGRKIRAMTQGHFIVITPRNWNRTGRIPFESEGCEDPGFRAHYFFKAASDSSEDVGGFEGRAINLTGTGFQLSGNFVFDNSDDGRLFVGSPPMLKLDRGVTWVRVGEEKTDGWGKNFRPTEKLEDVLNGRQGRFFLRIYGDMTTLVDSGEFRYFADLDEIQVNGEPYKPDLLLPPSPYGHASNSLRLVSADGTTIIPVLPGDNPTVTVLHDGVVTVPPDTRSNAITCILESESGSLEVQIELPRIWWRLSEFENEPGPWSDTSFVMTFDEFRQHATKGAEMQLRLPSCIRSVKAGFEGDLDQTFYVVHGIIGIPLRAFLDYEAIDGHFVKDVFLKVRCDGNTILKLIRVTSNLPCRFVALVKRAGGGCRAGRGFSLCELQRVGLSSAAAARLNLRVDKRRRSAHQENIQTLLEVKNDA